VKRKKQSKVKFHFEWSLAEREAWKLPRKVTVSEWADENRVLDAMSSAEPGQWRTERTPYLKGIMDAFTDPEIEDITIMSSTQVGKTESVYNCIGYIIDQDPAPILLVMPRGDDADYVSQNRLKPMLNASPALVKHKTKNLDDITKEKFQLDRMVLYFTGSNSPAGLASKPIRYLFFDEVDKFPKFSGKEADPIQLATERTRTFWNRKIVKVSTPTTREGYIFREYEKSDQRRYYVPCPECGHYQVLNFRPGVHYPEGERDPEVIRDKKLAWYECENCKRHIKDEEKSKMLNHGVWLAEGQKIKPDGTITGKRPKTTRAGFWFNALYSPWVSWSDVAAEFIRSKGYIELLMNFVNSWLAELWEEKAGESKPEVLIKLAGEHEEGVVPPGALVLTAGVDVQKDHFYIVIRGWGYSEESWLIRACRVESWEDMIAILFRTKYPKAKTNIKGVEPLSVRLSCIDSGYRTDEVYEVCRQWRDVARPTKGRDHIITSPYKVSSIDRHPQTGAIIKGGLSLFHLDTSHYKNKINRIVHAEPGDPTQWHLFKNPSEDYLRQFCAEHKKIERDRKTGRAKEEWTLISPGAPNHYLDCEVGAIAAADMLHVSAMREEEKQEVYQPRKSNGFINGEQSNWIKRGNKNWLNRG